MLVILGLLTGGILAGQSLIRAAELRSVGTEYSRYVTASQSFRDKYFALPGDMSNATSFWGTFGTCPGVAANSRAGASGTCNGNGDGSVTTTEGGLCNGPFCYWDHLSRAGLIEGSYSGVTGDAATYSNVGQIAGVNSPQSRFPNAIWQVFGDTNVPISHRQIIDGQYGNVAFLFAGASTTMIKPGVMSPAEAWNIDTKMDDGLAGKGNVVSMEMPVQCYRLFDGSPGSLSITLTRTDVNYDLTATGTLCGIAFRNAL